MIWMTVYALGVLFLLMWCLIPVVWSFIISITPRLDSMQSPAPLFPKNPTFENYKQLILATPDGRQNEGALFKVGLLNSVISSLASIVCGLPVCILAAYTFTRMNFWGKSVLKAMLLATLVIPVFACIVPLFQMFTVLGLTDNFIGLILVYVSSYMPLTIWILCSFFETLPHELEEAAVLDGCKPFRTIMSIILPVSYPVIFAVALIVFIATWNQFLIPLILAPSLSTKPIAVVISEFSTKTLTNYGLMNAGGIIAIIPPVVVAVLFRRFLIYGLTAGATRG
jgi:multiple sugar transport system permease protein